MEASWGHCIWHCGTNTWICTKGTGALIYLSAHVVHLTGNWLASTMGYTEVFTGGTIEPGSILLWNADWVSTLLWKYYCVSAKCDKYGSNCLVTTHSKGNCPFKWLQAHLYGLIYSFCLDCCFFWKKMPLKYLWGVNGQNSTMISVHVNDWLAELVIITSRVWTV